MKHYYMDIQGWFNFEGPYRDAVREAMDGSVFVELGCWKGRSSCFLAVEVVNSQKDIKLNFVDHWKGSDEPEHDSDPEKDLIFSIFTKNLSKACVAHSIFRTDTVSAAGLFEDNSVDFIWVDAGHEYSEVKADIEAWWPKLRAGGVMGGDDLPMNGVKQAVTEMFPQHEVGSENGWQWWRVRKRS